MASSFPKTRWSLIVEHQKESLSSEEEQRALDELCDIYWNPVRAFFRVLSPGRNDIDDFTQGFFAHVVIQNDLFSNATPDKGTLRSYLRGAAKKYFLNVLRSESALRRGGQNFQPDVFEDSDLAENDSFPAADEVFDRQWARGLLEFCLELLHKEHEEKDKGDLSLALRPLLIEDSPEARAKVAEQLGYTDSALRVCLHRYITRFRDIFRKEVQATLFPGASLEDEMMWIRDVLSKPEPDKL